MTEKKLVDRLNKRIKIQAKTNNNDGFGGYLETWSDSKILWAEIRPVSNLDSFRGKRIEEKITHIITIRHYAPLTTQHRIKYKNRIFGIVGIINTLENNQTMEIRAEEIL